MLGNRRGSGCFDDLREALNRSLSLSVLKFDVLFDSMPSSTLVMLPPSLISTFVLTPFGPIKDSWYVVPFSTFLGQTRSF